MIWINSCLVLIICIALLCQAKVYDVSATKVSKKKVSSAVTSKLNSKEFHTESVYGEDDRREPYEFISDDQIQNLVETTVLLVTWQELQYNSRQQTYVHTEASEFFYDNKLENNYCSSVPFVGQLKAGWCSGFLVAPDIIVTAAHCIDNADSCYQTAFIFDYKVINSGGEMSYDHDSIPSNKVYRCLKLLSWEKNPNNGHDFAIIRLDRSVESERSARIVAMDMANQPIGTPYIVVGHPSGLPMKVTPGGYKMSNTAIPYFEDANLDTFSGNSGSLVANANTGLIVGILVEGQTDFICSDGNADTCSGFSKCVQAYTCNEERGCPSGFETVSKIASVEKYLQNYHGIAVETNGIFQNMILQAQNFLLPIIGITNYSLKYTMKNVRLSLPDANSGFVISHPSLTIKQDERGAYYLFDLAKYRIEPYQMLFTASIDWTKIPSFEDSSRTRFQLADFYKSFEFSSVVTHDDVQFDGTDGVVYTESEPTLLTLYGRRVPFVCPGTIEVDVRNGICPSYDGIFQDCVPRQMDRIALYQFTVTVSGRVTLSTPCNAFESTTPPLDNVIQLRDVTEAGTETLNILCSDDVDNSINACSLTAKIANFEVRAGHTYVIQGSLIHSSEYDFSRYRNIFSLNIGAFNGARFLNCPTGAFAGPTYPTTAVLTGGVMASQECPSFERYDLSSPVPLPRVPTPVPVITIPDADCVIDWERFTTCTPTCASTQQGTRTRSGTIVTAGTGNGIICPSEPYEIAICIVPLCGTSVPPTPITAPTPIASSPLAPTPSIPSNNNTISVNAAANLIPTTILKWLTIAITIMAILYECEHYY